MSVKDYPIQITISRPIPQEEVGQAKSFGFSFKGNLADFERVQKGVDEVVSRILWEKEGEKKSDGSKEATKKEEVEEKQAV